MTKLEQLYNSIQNLKELGVQLPDKLIEETNRVEEEIIKNDIIPALAETISPIIEQIQREIILVVEYIPNEPLIVKLTRKRSFAIPAEQDINDISKNTDKKTLFDNDKSYTIPTHSKSKKTVLEVTFPNDKVLSFRFAYLTLCEVIKTVGVEKVRHLNILCNGIPLIDNKKDDYYQQHEFNNGLYLMTTSSTLSKKQQLDEISERLGLNLKVEII